jgi:GntR family transcriptional regulator of vanillate catabolism
MAPAGVSTASAADGGSQTVRAQLMLRELVLGGELEPGARIAELALVERIGVSRTPIRMALLQLQQEGLLDVLPAGGYTVKAFTESDVHDAIELRGTLEGLAARMAAERGVGGGLLAEASDCLARIDELLAQPELSEQSFATYVEQNGRFHGVLAEMAASELVQRQIQRACTLPFASPNAFVLQRSTGPRARDVLVIAQDQHRGLVDAIRRREGARAEAIAREHARIAQHNLGEVLQSQHALGSMPGAGLIRRRGRR